MNEIEIETRDGVCRSFVYRPAGSGPWPAVLVLMDGVGIRPAMLEVKARLETALTEAGVDHQIETYQAKHGWVFRDTPVYDAAATERHWQTLLALLDETLKP